MNKTLKIMMTISAISATASAPIAASAADRQRLWEFNITTTSGSSPAESTSSWVCLADSQLANPPENLTGPRCDDQAFTRTDDVLTWTANCDSARGNGQWTFSRGDKEIEGESQTYVQDTLVRTQIEGEVQDRCG